MRPLTVPAEPVESPCIKVCMLDAGQVCVGCGRSLEEIAAWSRMTTGQRRQVRCSAALRLQAQPGRGAPEVDTGSRACRSKDADS